MQIIDFSLDAFAKFIEFSEKMFCKKTIQNYILLCKRPQNCHNQQDTGIMHVTPIHAL